MYLLQPRTNAYTTTHHTLVPHSPAPWCTPRSFPWTEPFQMLYSPSTRRILLARRRRSADVPAPCAFSCGKIQDNSSAWSFVCCRIIEQKWKTTHDFEYSASISQILFRLKRILTTADHLACNHHDLPTLHTLETNLRLVWQNFQCSRWRLRRDMRWGTGCRKPRRLGHCEHESCLFLFLEAMAMVEVCRGWQR